MSKISLWLVVTISLFHTISSIAMEGAAVEIIAIEKTCSQCDKILKAPKKCSRCKSAFYCDPNCQSLDWNNHKRVCGKPKPHYLEEDGDAKEISIYDEPYTISEQEITLEWIENRFFRREKEAEYGRPIILTMNDNNVHTLKLHKSGADGHVFFAVNCATKENTVFKFFRHHPRGDILAKSRSRCSHRHLVIASYFNNKYIFAIYPNLGKSLDTLVPAHLPFNEQMAIARIQFSKMHRFNSDVLMPLLLDDGLEIGDFDNTGNYLINQEGEIIKRIDLDTLSDIYQ